jgi:hypothetical protein
MTAKHSITAACLMMAAGSLQAGVSPEAADKLGDSLTPMGAERAGNADGSIPAWEGGLTTVHPDFEPGGSYPDPYADEEPLFVIDGNNYEQYADKLSPGQIALLKRYDSWQMPVYPSHRSAAYPEGFYEETRQNATRVSLVEGGNGFEGASGGLAFPIPQSGVEAIWNHLTTYKGDMYSTRWAQAAVTQGGDYNLVRFDYEYDFDYSNQQRAPEERQDNLLFYFLQMVLEPPRLSGSILLVHEYANQVAEPRKAWTYNPGQRRVRLAPNVAYDNPGTAADGLRTNDDFAMFNGATDRYNWKLVGKQEMYIPYNAYRASSTALSIDDVLRPGHVNPEHVRYELHRVWVVEATLKEGTSHIYKRRTMYLDEDSWIVHVQDKYDNRDQLWRVDELHTMPFYDIPFLGTALEVKHDLQSGRYLAMTLRNESDKVYQPIERSPRDFAPAALRNKGVR